MNILGCARSPHLISVQNISVCIFFMIITAIKQLTNNSLIRLFLFSKTPMCPSLCKYTCILLIRDMNL